MLACACSIEHHDIGQLSFERRFHSHLYVRSAREKKNTALPQVRARVAAKWAAQCYRVQQGTRDTEQSAGDEKADRMDREGASHVERKDTRKRREEQRRMKRAREALQESKQKLAAAACCEWPRQRGRTKRRAESRREREAESPKSVCDRVACVCDERKCYRGSREIRDSCLLPVRPTSSSAQHPSSKGEKVE